MLKLLISYFHNHQARLYWRFDIWFSCKLRKLRIVEALAERARSRLGEEATRGQQRAAA
jgi:hypothetical protein